MLFPVDLVVFSSGPTPYTRACLRTQPNFERDCCRGGGRQFLRFAPHQARLYCPLSNLKATLFSKIRSAK
jgi:hypothetical protein